MRKCPRANSICGRYFLEDFGRWHLACCVIRNKNYEILIVEVIICIDGKRGCPELVSKNHTIHNDSISIIFDIRYGKGTYESYEDDGTRHSPFFLLRARNAKF